MKLTAVFLLAACLQLSARTIGQNVTISVKKAPVKEVFREIQKQTGLNVMVDATVLEKAGRVTLNVTNMPVEQVLNLCFKGENLSYNIVDGIIVVQPKPAATIQPEEISPTVTSPPPINISGKVSDEDGKPLVGASIIVKSKGKGTTTNTDGFFELANLVPEDIVEVSYTGFVSQSFKVGDRRSLSIKLKVNDNPLDQVQVLASGKTTQRYTTSNVQTVTSKEIEKQPVTNPLLALQGRVPGLVIQQQSGYANAGLAIEIRGQGSLSLNSTPLYVIDGIPYPQYMLSSLFNFGGGSGLRSAAGAENGSTLSFINPMDIESISILKDADAVSIYGSRAAGGAVLITTKKGKAGPTRVTVDFQQGWQKLTNFAKLLNTKQYLEMRHEGFKNSNRTPGPNDYDINGVWDTTRYTDWQKVLWGNTGKWTNANLNISGGNENTQYYFSSTYHKQTSIDLNPKGIYNQSGSGHLSINSTSSNQKFSFQSDVSYMFNLNNLPSYSGSTTVLTLAPDAPALFNADGSINWQPLPNGNESFDNPVAGLFNSTTRQRVKNLVANTRFTYKVFSDLELSLNAGYTDMQQSDYSKSLLDRIEFIAPSQRASSQRRTIYYNGYTSSWSIEPQLRYKKDLGQSRLDIFAGAPFQNQNSYQQQFQASGFIADGLMEDPRAAPVFQYNITGSSLFRSNGYFARINYSLANKYIFSLNGRRDGSSRFGPANKFHSFGSAAASWIFSNENFAKNSNWLSFGKLTGSYGTAGNDQVGDYQYLSSYYASQQNNVAYLGSSDLVPGNLPNSNLQWEVQRKLNATLDLGFAQDRVLLSVTYYRNRSSNQLLGITMPAITGFGSYNTNLPATIQNTGTEITLNTTNIKGLNLSWTSNLNVAIPRNKLVSYPDLSTSPYASTWIVGKSFSGNRIRSYAGVDPQTGLYQFYSSDGKKVFWNQMNYPEDATEFINYQPVFSGGFANSIKYKGFQLDFLFHFSQQRKARILPVNYPGSFNKNQPVEVLDRWQKTGDNASGQAFASNRTINQYISLIYLTTQSDYAFPLSYYVRLKNLSLSWQLPKKWVTKVGVSGCSIYSNAENILTITNYIGTDPESGSGTLPPLRVITTGIRVTF